MAEEKPAEPPSRWTVINDYSKTVVAVCAALLAFIGAFSTKLLDSHLSATAMGVVIAVIALLVISALCALAVPAMLDRYLCIAEKGAPPAGTPPTTKNLDTATQKEWDSRAERIRSIKAAANLSYLALSLAVVAMAIFAIYQAKHPAAAKTESPAVAITPDHYEIAYSASHKTGHGQQVHTFLLNQATGDIWQMVCAPDGMVSFRQLKRRDVDGNVIIENPAGARFPTLSPRPDASPKH
jgi:hypothetical protein